MLREYSFAAGYMKQCLVVVEPLLYKYTMMYQNTPRTSVKELEKEMPTNGYTNSKHICIFT